MIVWNCIINREGKLISTPSSATDRTAARAVALGFFDGVHLGHQKIFQTMLDVAEARSLRTAVQTFENPPSSKVQNHLITTYSERCGLVAHMGIDDLFAIPFNEQIKSMSPETFMEVCLKDWMHARAVIVGRDYRFGKGREGDVQTLQVWGARNGIEVISVDPVNFEGRRISSSWIRELIVDGEVEQAEHLLGHPVAFAGVVEKGQQLGRTLGFPTANIRIPEQKVIPKYGVYASAYCLDGKILPSITNIGLRPTVNQEDQIPLAETKILDGYFQLYGTKGSVALLKYIRPEQAFPNVEALKDQMNIDQEAVRNYHKNRQLPVRFDEYV